MKKKIFVLYNQVLSDNPDEMDVINQRDLVIRACENYNYKMIPKAIGRSVFTEIEAIKAEQPDMVFNLVEATWGKGELIYFVPALLNALKIPYTGVPLDALFVTTNKVLAKKIMRFNQIPTADFFTIKEMDQLDPAKRYIAKPIWEEASVGITEDYIFSTNEKEKLAKVSQLSSSHYFIEEFIDGREFNVSILTSKNGPEVLPPAEIQFSDYFDNKPKIVGYLAKWEEESEEYKGTNRVFGSLKDDPALENELREVCLNVWHAFNLKGYARVDFRVDSSGKVYVLEINGNPCISPDSGFVAATKQAGYSIVKMVERIMQDLN